MLVPFVFVICLIGTAAVAQSETTPVRTNLNKTTLSIISSDFSGPLRWMADDLASTLNDRDNIHVLPVFGIGSNETVPDALFLKAIDVAFVHSDLIEQTQRNGPDKNLRNHLRYIAKLYAKQVGVIAGQEYADIRSLAGKKVNFDHTTSSNFATSALIFDMLGIQVERVQLSQALAIEKIKSGEIAATVLVDDKPNQMIATLRSEQGVHLLPIRHAGPLQTVYQPASFTNDDYPNLVAPDQSIETVAVSVVMAMYNWPPNSGRYTRVAKFAEAFISRFDKLREAARHPKWREVNIAEPLPGWTRFKRAEELLASNGTLQNWEGAMSNLRVEFQKFVGRQSAASGANLTAEQKRALFKEFLGWKENTTKAMIRIHMTSIRGTGRLIGTISARNIEIVVGGTKELALLLEPDIVGLPSGVHAFHIHANPDCGPGSKNGILVAGLAAGGNLDLTQENKTYGGHLGDLPDLVVAATGTAREAIIVPRRNMADLLDRSIVIHADGTDKSARLACGVVH